MKIGIDEAEQTLLDELSELNLHQVISYEHFEPEEVHESEFGIGAKNAVAITTVELFDIDTWNESDEKSGLTPIAVGNAVCSAKDIFSKKKGRVSAGYRALKQMK